MMAMHVGAIRQTRNAKAGLQHAHGLKDPGWSEHIEGACAEAAVAKAFGRWWSPAIKKPDHSGDVGLVEVRHTTHRNGHLLLHKVDAPERAYVLVIGSAPNLTLAGWTWGYEAQRPDWWGEPRKGNGRPCFMAQKLAPMESLPLDAFDVARQVPRVHALR